MRAGAGRGGRGEAGAGMKKAPAGGEAGAGMKKSPGRVGDRGTAMHGVRARYSSTSSN